MILLIEVAEWVSLVLGVLSGFEEGCMVSSPNPSKRVSTSTDALDSMNATWPAEVDWL